MEIMTFPVRGGPFDFGGGGGGGGGKIQTVEEFFFRPGEQDRYFFL
jgi:hypothetical protein